MSEIVEDAIDKQFWVAYYLHHKFIDKPSTKAIQITTDEFDVLPEEEFMDILKKFAVDYKIISMLPDPHKFENWYDINMDNSQMTKSCVVREEETFANFFEELFEIFKEKTEKRKAEIEDETNKIVYQLSYENGQLLINNDYQLVKTRYNSINARLLEYLFKNQNRTILREEFEEKSVLRKDKKEDKDFYIVLEDIKIKGDLRKLFFSTNLSKHSLHLKNPIREKDLEENNIKNLNLDSIATKIN